MNTRTTAVVLCFCICSVIFPIKTFSEPIDSLKRELKLEKTDTGRVLMFNKVAREIANTTQLTPVSGRKKRYEEALQYADSGLTLSRNITFRRGEAELYRTVGAVYYYLSDYDSAVSYYDRAFEVSSELNDEYGKTALMYNLAIIYGEQGKHVQALKHYFVAASGWEHLGIKTHLQKTDALISHIYKEMGEYKLSVEYAQKSLELAFELNDTLNAASLYDILAGNYLSLHDTVSGTDAYEKSLALYRSKKNVASEARILFNYASNITSMPFDKRKSMLIRAQKLFEQFDPEHQNLAIVYLDLASGYRAIGKRDSIGYYRNKALKQILLAKHDPTAIYVYTRLGDELLLDNRPDKAEAYYLAAQETNGRVGSTTTERDIYAGLYRIYEQKGDHKRAFEIMQRSVRMQDSIAAEESKKRLEVLQMQYEMKETQDRQEAEWKLQADRQEQKYQRRRRAITYILIAMGVFAVLTGKTVLNYRRNKRNSYLLQERREEILQIQEELRQSNDELNMYKEYLEDMVRQQTIAQADKEQQLHTISNNLSGGFIYRKTITSDGRTKLSYVSNNVEQLLGISAERLRNAVENWTLHTREDNLIQKIAEREEAAIRNSEPLSYEFKYTGNGRSLWLYNHSLPHAGSSGEIVWDGFVIDITKQKKVESSLKEAKEEAEEADRLKSVFLSNMSHEIRTPMNAILGFVGFIENEGISDDKRNEYIRIVRDSANQLLQLIGNIIDISKLEVRQVIIHPTEFALNAFMRETEQTFSTLTETDKHLDIILDTGRFIEPNIICNDRERLRQVLFNLIDNAVKYTDKGYIRFGYEPTDDLSELLFFVEDTGIGIPPDQRNVIFERFRQAANTELRPKYRGTGLGLSISKGLVELMGGRIWADSSEGRGSTFFFTIKKNLHITT